MAITVEEVEDQVEVVGPYQIVQVRISRIVKEDGVEVGRSYHRLSATPDSDPNDFSPYVQSIIAAVQTPEVKAAWASIEPTPGG